MIKIDKSMIGKKVKLIQKVSIEDPPVGSKGEIIYFDSASRAFMHYQVYFPEYGEALWLFDDQIVELDEEKMSDMDIWEMFKIKMNKLNINPDFMYLSDVRKLVAVAYRSGYGRGEKGKPFDFRKKETKK